MVSYFQERQESEYLTQNPVFDALYCEEEEDVRFDGNVYGGLGDFDEIQKEESFACLSEHDLVWEDDELDALLSKERCVEMGTNGCLETTREEAIAWMLKVIGFYGFNAATAVLAVNYYDRFIARVCFQKDVPWMTQLAAVACLSIAAKVEETQVPVLLDLQV